MKTKIAAILCALTLLPSIAAAACQGDDHAQTTMSCTDGKVFDAASKTCLPVSG
ncbi:hypothetical protein [Pseudorhodobacter ferrugineus]|uniref:hypothetical protein n=1 Tax=Pseudorhodobacter ferrugineus TaxID=77008 RepID=UPI0003B4FA16|nr:hypothetical protein [Pseudorhodobacter ferrugineus]